MKSVIPTKTGHIPLLLYFHLSNVWHGRRKEDEGRFDCTVYSSPKSGRLSGVYDSHSLWSEGEGVGKREEVWVMVVRRRQALAAGNRRPIDF